MERRPASVTPDVETENKLEIALLGEPATDRTRSTVLAQFGIRRRSRVPRMLQGETCDGERCYDDAEGRVDAGESGTRAAAGAGVAAGYDGRVVAGIAGVSEEIVNSE